MFKAISLNDLDKLLDISVHVNSRAHAEKAYIENHKMNFEVTVKHHALKHLSAFRSAIALKDVQVKPYDISPLFDQRLLCIDKHLTAASSAHLEAFFSKIAELGFNSVMFGKYEQMEDLDQYVTLLNKVIQQGNKWEIRVYADISWINSTNITKLEALENCVGLYGVMYAPRFWHSFNKNSTSKHLTSEGVYFALNILRKHLSEKLQLIFALQPKLAHQAQFHAQAFEELIGNLPINTKFAFTSHCGFIDKPQPSPHPVWQKLNYLSSNYQDIAIMFNPGLIGLGEGLWPLLQPNAYDWMISAASRHKFSTVIAWIPRLPTGPGFLDLNIWSFGHRLWSGSSLWELQQAWLKLHHKDWDVSGYFFEHLQHLANHLMGIYHYGCEGGVPDTEDRLNACFKTIESLKHRIQAEVKSTQLEKYALFFLRDMKKFAIFVAQQNHLSHPAPDDEDVEFSFWSTATGTLPTSKITIHKQPVATSEHFEVTQILQDNGYIF